MINQKRVKQMIKMAMFERKYGDEYKEFIHYKRRDYLSMIGTSSFFAGTAFFLLVYGAVIAGVLGSVIQNLSKMVIMMLVIIGVLLYALYIFIHVYTCRRSAEKKYKRGRKMIKALAEEFDNLQKIYDEEERTASVDMGRKQ